MEDMHPLIQQSQYIAAKYFVMQGAGIPTTPALAYFPQ